ncbi:phosphotransferase [Pirellulales bacterium]|nr:phosphotransferase [Pirellulales bacterium]
MVDQPELAALAAGLACWSGPVQPEPVYGGITNTNFVVRDGDLSYFVRIGEDVPVHGIVRANEVSAARAAEAAGVSPPLVYNEPGVIVTQFVDGRTLQPEDFRSAAMLERVARLLQKCHYEIPKHLRGPIQMFWAFHVIRDYAATLRDARSRSVPILPELLASADVLEADVGRIEVVFAHNDLLAANFIDDGRRLWLVDWDYGGFGSPLFDLGGLASNNQLSSEEETALLEIYFGGAVDAETRHRFEAMKCVSLLREAMWSMASEIHSKIEFDYRSYTDEYLARFNRAYANYECT